MNSNNFPAPQQAPKRQIYCPPALLSEKNWLSWALDGDQKIPTDIHGNKSGSTRTEDYCTFAEIVNAGRNPAFCFAADDDYVGIDLDDCIIDGKLASWAVEIVKAFEATYIEASPSQTGVHIICRGKKAANVICKTKAAELAWTADDEVGCIEVYDHGRFFTWTGARATTAGVDVVDMQPQLDWICEKFLKKKQPAPTAMVQAAGVAGGGWNLKRAIGYMDTVPGMPADTDRNNTAFQKAGKLYSNGCSHEDIVTAIQSWNERNSPPLDQAELLKAITGGIERGTRPDPTPERADLVFTPEQEAAFNELGEWCRKWRWSEDEGVMPAKIAGVEPPASAEPDLEGWTPSLEFLEKFDLTPSHPQIAEFIKALLEGGSIIIRDGDRPKKYIFEAPDTEKGFNEKYAKWSEHLLPLERSPSQRHKQYPAMKPIIIDGLLRETEILNVIAAPKVGKSWFAMQMAVSVALGIDFLGQPTQQQKVFILDNELHPETAVDRLELMCQKMGISPVDLDGKLVVDNLRGSLSPLDELEDYFGELQGYGLIVLDALYRLLPRGISENDNAAMTEVYNMLDDIAAGTGAAICCVHHTSKGDQSNKSTTDIGSGAGSQSRAADSHLTMLPHEIEDCVVLGGVVRSFAQNFRPLTLKREFPTWIEKPMIAADVKKPEGAKAKVDTAERDEAVFQILKKLGKPSTANQLYESKGSAAFGKQTIKASLAELVEQGDVTVEESEVKGRTRSLYSLQPSALNHETLADYRSEKWDFQC